MARFGLYSRTNSVLSLIAARYRPVVAICVCVCAPASAQAEVKIHQIAQLLLLKTDCTLTDVLPAPADEGQMRFKGICSNVSFYPDGIDVACADREDERTCRILTEKKEFKHLDLFKRR